MSSYKWRLILGNLIFKSHKHAENLGVMKNIIYCLNFATSKYIWTISHDDPIQNITVAFIISKLKQQEK